mmetsp:Transcript_32395/g.59621  ORF Transcript_32395/g.59621 Transcript_32395/m.59621 type:complete len:83 (+) Transcript_32395:25-273(+)
MFCVLCFMDNQERVHMENSDTAVGVSTRTCQAQNVDCKGHDRARCVRRNGQVNALEGKQVELRVNKESPPFQTSLLSSPVHI